MTPRTIRRPGQAGPQPHPLRLRGPGRPRHPAELLSQARRGPYSYLFESVQGGEKWGRYSIIGLPCRTRAQGLRHTGFRSSATAPWSSRPRPRPAGLDRAIPATLQRRRPSGHAALRRRPGRLLRLRHRALHRAAADALPEPGPDGHAGHPADGVRGGRRLRQPARAHLHHRPPGPRAGDTPTTGQARIDALVAQDAARRAAHPGRRRSRVRETDFVSGFTEDGFKQAVERIKDYILEGDCMQVVLSQRLSIPFQARPLDLYRACAGSTHRPTCTSSTSASSRSSARRRRS
jgi:anthranilate synthase component 1